MQTGDDARNPNKYTPRGHRSSSPDDLMREWVAAINREEAEAELYALVARAHMRGHQFPALPVTRLSSDDGGTPPSAPPARPAAPPPASPAPSSPCTHRPVPFEDVIGRLLDDGGLVREGD